MYKLIAATILLAGIIVGVTQAQPTIKFKAMNETLVDGNTVRFDIYVENTGTDSASYLYSQSYVNYNAVVLNGGTVSCTYVTGSSQLPASHSGLFALSTTTVGRVGLFYTAAPLPVNEIKIPVGGSIKLATLEFSTTASSFTSDTLALVWRTYSGSNPKTKYFYVNTGVVTELTTAGNYTYYVAPEFPLPVELTTFEATQEGRNIKLQWETKTEVNSNMYEVERSAVSTSTGARTWNKIGEVSASGTTTTPSQYSFVDNKLQSGKYAYRLKIVDNDGTYEYSKEVESEIALPKDYAISQNYPNPFNPSTRIDYQLPFDSKVTIELYGITGEKVGMIINSELAAGYYTAEINAGALNLASGMYIYRMNASGQNNQNFVQVKKLMLTK